MKTLKTILCGLGLLLASALQAQDDWTLQSPATKPSAQNNPAMASLGGDQVLLFGGILSGNDETWVYDLSDNTWTLKNPTTKPSARYYHAMASLGGDQVLLFGGNDGAFDDETWVYDLSEDNWTQKFPTSSSPSARQRFPMASLGGDQVLLFGGYDGAYDDETWVYDLSDNTWTLKSPATKPSAREQHAMASLGGDQVLLFGGQYGPKDDETWVYDLSDNNWTQKSPTTKPSARYYHAMASLGGDQVLLFGGGDASGGDNETWVYDLSDNTWTIKSPATKPSARIRHAMASLGGGQVLLFGGRSPAETWVYTATPNTAPVNAVPGPQATNENTPLVFSSGNGNAISISDVDAGGASVQVTLTATNGTLTLAGVSGLTFGSGDGTADVTMEFIGTISDINAALNGLSFAPTANFNGPASLQIVTNDQGNTGSGDPLSDDDTVNITVNALVKPFVFVANKVTLKGTKQSTSTGDIHSNGLLTVEKGKPSTYNSNFTAVGKITINKQNTINGNVKSQTSISNSGTITGTPSIGPVNVEPLPSLSYSAGGLNKTVPNGGSLTLAPDSYGIVTMSQGGTLKLTSGEYFMNELRYASTIEGGTIQIDLSSGDPITINVVTNLQLGHEAAIVLLPNGESDSKLVTFNTMQSTAANWGREAYLLGSFNAPNAIVTLVKNTQLRGSICAKEILVSNDCLFLHHDSPGTLPGPGNLPKSSGEDEEEVSSDQLAVISDYALAQNYPNPFNPSTVISFQLPVNGEVTLSIFNTSGQLVKQLVAGEMNAGQHSLTWDATNERGERVASGVYLYVIKAGEFTAQRKLVLMK